MPMISTNDTELYVDIEGEGPPLLLLNGATDADEDARGSWIGLVGWFSRFYRTIHAEHRGHGRSAESKLPHTYSLYADDAVGVLDELGIEKAHVAGISDGAITALDMGMRHPGRVKSIVALGANATVDETVADMLWYFDPEEMAKRIPENVERFEFFHDTHHEPGYWKRLLVQLGENIASNPNWSAEDLKAIKAPTLLIAGDKDPYANAEQMRFMFDNIPHAQQLIIPNAGHVVQFTHPDIVGRAVLEFLQTHV